MINLKELYFNHLAQTSKTSLALEIHDANGVYLYSPDGKNYIDLIAGVSVANLGHKNKRIIKAIEIQANRYLHLMVYGEIIQAPQVLLSKKLNDFLPESLNSTYFLNSGSEAIETAMKLAKRVTGRTEIIACRNAYHGSTQGALSLQSSDYFTASYRPLLPDVKHINFNSFEDLEKISKKTACIIIEPIQGEAGVILPKNDYLQKLKQRCIETESLLVFDEIQTGFGRTGELFAFQNFNVIPDILVLAKALGGGLPLGAVVSSKEIMDYFTENPSLGHITTFGGHPLSCAAALESLNILTENNEIINSVESKANLFVELLKNTNLFKEIRYSGLLMAVDLENPDTFFNFLPYLYENGIHTDWFLFNDHSFRISPPLTISEDEIKESVNRILNAVNKFQNND
ncbi:MAG: aspartate aminotransferase family protein [Bacteroidales bacterium]|nr:aspartate aminotransferase family protein [Bacteroidales bacterium]